MARVFGLTGWGKVRYLYVPAALPSFTAACRVGLGLCWKSGVAAEVIGITRGSIGEKLYDAKLLFDTAELLAWTVVIVLLSLAFEKLFLRALAAAVRPVHRVRGPVCRPAQSGTPAAVGVEGVTLRYGAQTVLDQVTVRFPREAPVCVMAPSGRGKTTLLLSLIHIFSTFSSKAEMDLQIFEIPFKILRFSARPLVKICNKRPDIFGLLHNPYPPVRRKTGKKAAGAKPARGITCLIRTRSQSPAAPHGRQG